MNLIQRFITLLPGVGILSVALWLLMGVYCPAPTSDVDWPTTLKSTLEQSWQFYKDHMMENGERVASEYYGGTITEGQSYAMMKAVWMNDPAVFEKTWQWTRKHLKRPDDALLAWRWGKRNDGSMGIIGVENATDGDQDIAYALLLASEKWNRPDYREAAVSIVQDLWRLNVEKLHGRYYLVPGTWPEFRNDYLTLNPSYFAPYVYRKFATYDTAHASGWRQLAQDIYPTLEACSALTANKLPPNWCAVDYQTGRIIYSDKQGPTARDFTYDAFRVFWRMGMDAAMGSSQARRYLERHQAQEQFWQKNGYLPEGFSYQGKPLSDSNSGFALSALLAQRHVLSPASDAKHYAALLGWAYHPKGYWFNHHNDFLHSVIWLHLYTLVLGIPKEGEISAL